jgi:hypothetical protein
MILRHYVRTRPEIICKIHGIVTTRKMGDMCVKVNPLF